MKPYENYTSINEKWFNEFPSHWKIKRLKEILKQRIEKNEPIVTDNILSLSAANGVLPYLEKTDKGGNKPKNDLTKYNVARKNDLLVNCMNVVSGAAGITKWDGAISPVYYALYPRNNETNIWYYHNVFRLYSFNRSLLGLGKGILMHETDSGKLNTVRMRIAMNVFNNVLLSVPPRDEQDQIVKYLDWQISKINKLINAKKKQIALLNEQKQALINKAVTKGLDDTAPMKDSGIYWLKKVPTTWKDSRVKRICKVNASISEYRKNYADNDMIVFLPMENISVKGEINCSIRKKYSEVKTGFTSFLKNDVVIAKITPCFENGKGACLDKLETEIGFGTTELITLRPYESCIPKYLYYITMTTYFRKLGADIMTGSAGQKRISSDFVSNFEIGIPEISMQERIVKYIEDRFIKIDYIIEKADLEIIKLQEYKTSLISSVVTGKMDVRDIVVPKYEAVEELVEDNSKINSLEDSATEEE